MNAPAQTPLPRRVRGFTLIEQIAVTAIAGSVSTLALPSLLEFHAQADQAALVSLAAAAGSAMVLNQAGCQVTGQQVAAGKCQAISDCQQVSSLLLAELPAGYRVLPQPLAADGVHGSAQTCQLQRDSDGASAGFHGLAAGR